MARHGQGVIAWAVALLCGACSAHSTQVPRTQLPELVRNFGERGSVHVRYDGKDAEVTRAHEPVLEIEQKPEPTAAGQAGGDGVPAARSRSLQAPLASVQLQGGSLLFPLDAQGAVHARVRIRDVRLARLDLGSYHPPAERLLWGVGLGAGGPSLLLAPFVDFRPVPWGGFELGGLGGPGGAWAFVAGRVGPWQFGVVRPFIGGFFQGLLGWDADADRSTGPSNTDAEETTLSAAGPRAGVEIEFQRGHAVLRGEFDLVHPISKRWAFGGLRSDEWIPFGGVSFSYFP